MRPAEVAADPANRWTLELSNGGRWWCSFAPTPRRLHVERIKTLTRQGFYNGLTVPPGDPRLHGPGRRSQGRRHRRLELPDLKAEFNACRTCAAPSRGPRNEPDSANSQFYIMFVAAHVAGRQVYRVRPGDFRA
jgi:cyclophilin family peptidyl-prolyl cis-trans isomerase